MVEIVIKHVCSSYSNIKFMNIVPLECSCALLETFQCRYYETLYFSSRSRYEVKILQLRSSSIHKPNTVLLD